MDVLPANGDKPHKKRSRAPLDASILYSNGGTPKSRRHEDGKLHHKKQEPDDDPDDWMKQLETELFGGPLSTGKRRLPDEDYYGDSRKFPGPDPPDGSDHDEAASVSKPTGQVGDEEDVHYEKPIHFVDHREAFDRIKLYAESRYKDYSKQLSELLKTKADTYYNPIHSRRGFDGDLRMHQLRQDLLGFEDRPIELQMKMHEAAFSIEGPLIYGEEFFANKKLILEKNGWEPRLSVLFILTQRKMGKTYFLGQHAVVHAMNPCVADMRIAVISRTLDQAILTVAIFRKLFNTHKRRGEFTLTTNQVRRVTISKDGKDSEIRAYSGNPDVRDPYFLRSACTFFFRGGMCGRYLGSIARARHKESNAQVSYYYYIRLTHVSRLQKRSRGGGRAPGT